MTFTSAIVQAAGGLVRKDSSCTMAMGIGAFSIAGFSLAVLGSFVWMASNHMRRNRLLDLFFHHNDRGQRRKELQMLGLAVGLGLFLAVLIAAAIYVLNVTNRLQ